MTECSRFHIPSTENKNKKSVEKSQPFNLIINNTILPLIDFHAHSSENEIIGLLGGKYDKMKNG